MSAICDECMEWFVQGGVRSNAEYFAPNAVPISGEAFCEFCNVTQPDCVERPDFSVRDNTAHWERPTCLA